MNDKRYALRNKQNGYYYNGHSADSFFIQDVGRPADISPENIYKTEAIAELKLSSLPLRNSYTVEKIGLYEKPKCPYDMFDNAPPILKRGGHGEVCTNCGINIVIDEPYIRWKAGATFCLHCLEEVLAETEDRCNETPASLQIEWQEEGKKECEKCMADI
jgi:hypothetical protein